MATQSEHGIRSIILNTPQAWDAARARIDVASCVRVLVNSFNPALRHQDRVRQARMAAQAVARAANVTDLEPVRLASALAAWVWARVAVADAEVLVVEAHKALLAARVAAHADHTNPDKTATKFQHQYDYDHAHADREEAREVECQAQGMAQFTLSMLAPPDDSAP